MAVGWLWSSAAPFPEEPGARTGMARADRGLEPAVICSPAEVTWALAGPGSNTQVDRATAVATIALAAWVWLEPIAVTWRSSARLLDSLERHRTP